MNSPRRGADLALATALAQPPTLAAGRLLCVDGPAGSGKTTFAGHLAQAAPHTGVVHMDDLYQGWQGLAAGIRQLCAIVSSLVAGEPAFYQRWDWASNTWAEQRRVTPGGLLVVEGVGAGCARIAAQITTLVWLEADPAVRLQRAIERDGEALADHLREWQQAEARYFATDQPRARADLVLDTGGEPDRAGIG